MTKDELIELNMLREERKRLKSKKPKTGGKLVHADSSEDSEDDNKKQKKDGESSSDSEGEELDEVNDALSPMDHQSRVQMAQKSRTSVSAEVFGKYHAKAEFKPKVV